MKTRETASDVPIHIVCISGVARGGVEGIAATPLPLEMLRKFKNHFNGL